MSKYFKTVFHCVLVAVNSEAVVHMYCWLTGYIFSRCLMLGHFQAKIQVEMGQGKFKVKKGALS